MILVIVECPNPKTSQLLPKPDHFFLVTSYSAEQQPVKASLEHYRQRGSNWIGTTSTADVTPMGSDKSSASS